MDDDSSVSSRFLFLEPDLDAGSLLGRSDAHRPGVRGHPIFRRLRVAARWHAEAFWSRSDEHAILGLGIAFDALLGEEGGSPGRVLAERFALLEENADIRREKHEMFSKRIYPACSTVAHGGRSPVLDAGAFRRDVARELGWAGTRLHELATRQGIGGEDHRRLFDDLERGLK